MKPQRVVLARLVVFLSFVVSAQAVELFRLENGLTVLVDSDRRVPLVNVTCLYRVGSANESPGITGIAHYVEHMNFRATANVSKADITGFINRIGGRWNGYTSLEQTLYAATVPSWALEEVFRIESERMARTRFLAGDFARERTSVIAELQGYQNDPGSLLWDLGVATSFEIHPYRYNIIGWLNDVLSISRDRAYRFYRDYYGPNNAILAVVGDTDVDAVRKLAAKYFGKLPRAPFDSAVNVVEPPQLGEKRASLIHPAAAPQVLLMYSAPAATDPDFAILMVLDAILAGGRDILSLPGTENAGPSGRLGARLEPYGVTGVETALTPTRSPYVYGIRLFLRAEAAPENLLSQFNREVASLLESTTDQDLQEAHHRLLAYQTYASDELAERAHRLAYFEGLGSWTLAGNLGRHISEVGKSDLLSYVSNRLQPHQRTVALLHPGDLGLPGPSIPPTAAAAEQGDKRPSPVPPRALGEFGGSTPDFLQQRSRSGLTLAAGTLPGTLTTLLVRLGIGSNLDPPGKEGLAMLCAEILESHPELSAQLDRLGAVRDSADSTDSVVFREFWDTRITFLSRDLSRVAPILAATLAPPAVSEETVNRARSRLEERLESLFQDAPWRARQVAAEQLFDNRAPGYGTAASRAGLTVQDVRAFLEEHFQAAKAWGVAVGPDSPRQGIALLETVLANIPTARATIAPDSANSKPISLSDSLLLFPLAGKTQAEVFAVLPAPARDDPAYLALRMLNYILGETGYAGRLGQALVDQGLTYSVYAVLSAGRLPGLWTIETGAAPANLDAVLDAIRREVSKLSQGDVAAWELREAQAYLLGTLLRRIESAPNLAALILEDLYLGRTPLAFAQLRQQIMGTGLPELKAAARKYLRPDALSLAAAGAVEIPE